MQNDKSRASPTVHFGHLSFVIYHSHHGLVVLASAAAGPAAERIAIVWWNSFSTVSPGFAPATLRVKRTRTAIGGPLSVLPSAFVCRPSHDSTQVVPSQYSK